MNAALTRTQVEKQVNVLIDGTACTVPAGITIAVALLLVRHPDEGVTGTRNVYCGMGSCYECVAEVNGVPGTRTCITPVADGMRVNTKGTKTRG